MKLFKIALWKKIIIGMILGLLIGSVWGKFGTALEPIGTLFITAIQMLVVPLVFCSLVTAMTSVSDLRKMGRIGGKAVIFYLLTSIAAVFIGILMAEILHPGTGFQFTEAVSDFNQPNQSSSVLATLLNIIPSNPFNALSSGNILQIISFALLLGICINLIGKEGKPLIPVFQAATSAMFKLTSLVMEMAPIGVFALMASLAGTYGASSLKTLMSLILVVYLGYVVLILLVYLPVIWFKIKISPIKFFRKILEVCIVAFTTSSSSATLPVSMSCAEKKLGISKAVTSFVLPLGSTVNMNGTALYQGVAALFIAHVYGIHLAFADTFVIALTAILGAIGTAGVPGAGVIMLSIVLNSVGLPIEGIGIILAVDRLIDMGRSAFNVGGDLLTAMVVAKSEHEVDPDILNAMDDDLYKNDKVLMEENKVTDIPRTYR